jgi:hypothetical protein
MGWEGWMLGGWMEEVKRHTGAWRYSRIVLAEIYQARMSSFSE